MPQNATNSKSNQSCQNTEAKLRKRLSEYLMVEQHSPYGNELVNTLVNLFKRKHRRPLIRLAGDRYFGRLIRELLAKWNIQTVSVIDSQNEGHECEEIYVPGPQERDQDLPVVISYMIHEFVRESDDTMTKHRFPNCPAGICGLTILMLLDHTLWPDFEYIRQFLERAIAQDWSGTGGFIEARKAIDS
jgi:hypothetical protein